MAPYAKERIVLLRSSTILTTIRGREAPNKWYVYVGAQPQLKGTGEACSVTKGRGAPRCIDKTYSECSFFLCSAHKERKNTNRLAEGPQALSGVKQNAQHKAVLYSRAFRPCGSYVGAFRPPLTVAAPQAQLLKRRAAP